MENQYSQYEQYYDNQRGTYIFPLAMLEDLSTLHVGHFDNLKIDTGLMRVWLCRCGVADGMAYDNQVTIERPRPDPPVYGRWVETAIYQAI